MKKAVSRKIKKEKSFRERINYEKNKEFYWVLIVMVVLLVVLLSASAIFKSFNRFSYSGLVFTKERFGQIPVYHHYYFFADPLSNQQYIYNLYLRMDPRTNYVPVQGEISFPYGNLVYLSINGTGLTQCANASRDIGTISSFLTLNLIPVKAATPDKKEAKINNITYADCTSNPDNIVILIKSGNTTRILKERDRCYSISIANCETLQAIEKFEVQAVLDSRNNY